MTSPAYKSHSTADVNQGNAAVSVPAPTPAPADGDYQVVALMLASSSIDVPATAPSGWVESANFVVDSPSSGASGSSRFVLFEIDSAATLTEQQASFDLTLTGDRVWVAVRGCYTLPPGSTGRTVAISTLAEATGTASTTHAVPSVTTTAPDSLVIGFGASDQFDQVAPSQSWPSTAPFTQRADHTGPNPIEIISVTMADLAAPTAGTVSGHTFTSESADECAMAALVLDGVSAGGPVALDGDADVASAASGTLTATRPLSGAGPVAAIAAAGLDLARPVAGDVSAASSARGELSVARHLAGSTPAAADAAGALTTEGEASLAGVAATASGASGALTLTRPLAGAAAAAAAGAGELTVGNFVCQDLAASVAAVAHSGVFFAVAHGGAVDEAISHSATAVAASGYGARDIALCGR